MATCPNCGNQAGEGAVFCDQCGTRIPQPDSAAPPVPAAEAAPAPAAGSVICPACGAGNVPGEAFCDYCGSPLDAPVPTVEEVPELEPVSAAAELEVEPEPAAPPEPAAEKAVAEEPAPAAAQAAEESPTCPACGAAVVPGEAFCADCGASLAEAPLPPEPVAEVELPPPPEPPSEPAPVVEEAAPVPEAAPVEPTPAPEPEAAAPPPPPPPPAPEPVGPPTCPACGDENEAGDAFCSSCGYALQEAAPAAAPPVQAPAGPCLIVAASGAEIPLPASAEIMIGREDPVSGVYPDVDLTPHGGEDGGVSRQHARIIVEGGSYFVEDLDSTNFTFVNKQKVAPKTRQALNNGDELRCGRVTLVLKTG